MRHRFWATGVPGWAAAPMPPAAYSNPQGWSPSPEDEMSALSRQAQALRQQLEAIEQRLARLNPQDEDSEPLR